MTTSAISSKSSEEYFFIKNDLTASHKEIVKEYLRNKNFDQELAGEVQKYGGKYRCEVLMHGTIPKGLIIFSKSLSDHSTFLLKEFTLLPGANDQEKCHNHLVDRVQKLALKNKATKIHLSLENPDSEAAYFLKVKGFVEIVQKTPQESLKYSLIKRLENNSETTKKRKPEDIELQQNEKRIKPSLDLELDAINKAKTSSKMETDPVEDKKSVSGEVKTHFLPMKGAEYLNAIMQGKKLFEGRVNGDTCKKMRVGDYIKLFDRYARWGILCKISTLNTYKDFQEMLKDKGVLPMLPQLEEKAKRYSEDQLIKEGVKIYQNFPAANRVNRFGAIAIGVKFLEKVFK